MFYITPDLARYERRVFSQFGEDGAIERLLTDLKLEKGTFFEFGIGPADRASFDQPLEGNFVLLRQNGWEGVFLDGAPYLPPDVGVRSAFITALNINHIYAKHGLTAELDCMSIDIDGQDFWIWMALQSRPKIVVIEYNGGLGPDLSQSIQFDVTHSWDGTIYQGASLLAMDKLAKAKSYTLVFANGVNAIFVRDDLVANREDFSFDRLFTSHHPHVPDPLNRPWVTI